jgi:hypothetical protein
MSSIIKQGKMAEDKSNRGIVDAIVMGYVGSEKRY